MKNIFYSLLFSIIVLSSCDYVRNPYPETNANLGDTTTCPVPTFPTLTVHTKKILIEDYTGHVCPNCPRGARKLHDLDSTYPGRIIGLAVAAGGLAAPTPGFAGSPSTAYLADYRTTVGTTYDAFFGANAFGLPAGMLNRKYDASNSTYIRFYLNWATEIVPFLAEPCDADLQMITNFNDTTGKLCCAIKTSFLNNLSGDYKLVALIVQDSIIDWQNDVDATAPGNVPNYVHRHMLRDAITPAGAWGELIANSPVAGASDIKRFAYTIPSQYNGIPVDLNHCFIIAYLYNTTTYEVIQSEEVKVIP